jgi:hypothetical protein
MKNVTFASFGTATGGAYTGSWSGACPANATYAVNAACHGSGEASTLQATCGGQSACVVTPSIALFGISDSSSACAGSSVLYLLYNITCSAAPPTPSPTPSPSLPAPATYCESTGGSGSIVSRGAGAGRSSCCSQ